MNSLLEALPRTEKPNKAREKGFIPGVIYGKGMDSVTVKFTENKLKSIMRSQGKVAKISVKVGDEVKPCFIREIQVDSVSNKLLHVSMQVVKENETVKVKVPIIFVGNEELAAKRHFLLISFSEVEVTGPSASIPDSVTIEVQDKKPGDRITGEDLEKMMPASLKLTDDPEKVYAMVTTAKDNRSQSDESSDTENSGTEI